MPNFERNSSVISSMGMKNILALPGDYSGQGFGGQGAAIFGLDSVQLQIMQAMLSKRDPDGFFPAARCRPLNSLLESCMPNTPKFAGKLLLVLVSRFLILDTLPVNMLNRSTICFSVITGHFRHFTRAYAVVCTTRLQNA